MPLFDMAETEWFAADSSTLLREVRWAVLSGEPQDVHPRLTRRLGLYACACCRHLWDGLSEEDRALVEIAERYVDGAAAREELEAAIARRPAVDEIGKDADVAGAAAAMVLQTFAVPGAEAEHTHADGESHAYEPGEPMAEYWAEQAAAAKRRVDDYYYVTYTFESAVEFAAVIQFHGSEASWQLSPAELDAAIDAIDQQTQRAKADLFRDIFGGLFHPVTVDPKWQKSTAGAIARVIYDERAFDQLPILADALEDCGCNDTRVFDHCRQAGLHARGCWVVDAVLGKGR